MKVNLFIKIFSVLVFLYGIFGFFILPGMLKNEIIKNAEPMLKRAVSIKDVSVNPFTFKFTLQGLDIHDDDQKEPLFSMREFRTDFDPLYLLLGEVRFGLIKFSGPEFFVHKKEDGTFNFSDLLVSSETNTTTSSNEPTSIPPFLITKFAVRSGTVHFLDESGGRHFKEKLEPIDFTLRDFSSQNEHRNNISLHLAVDDGAYFDYEGSILSIKPLKLEGSMKLHSGRMYTQWRYFQEKLGFIVADGALDASLDYTADLSAQPLELNINKYELNIDALRLQDKATKEDVLALPRLHLHGHADIAQQDVVLENFEVNGLSMQVIRDDTGNINWSNYVQTDTEADEQTAEEAIAVETNRTSERPWRLTISDVKVNTEVLRYIEHYAKAPYEAGITGVELNVKGIQIDAEKFDIPDYSLAIQGVSLVGKSNGLKPFYLGSLALEGDADLKNSRINIDRVDLKDAKVQVALQDNGVLDINDFIPYSSKSDEGEISAKEQNGTLHWKVDTVHLEEGGFILEDELNAQQGKITIEHVEVDLKGLSSIPETKAKADLQAMVNANARLKVNAVIKQSPLDVEATISLKGLELIKFQPYLEKHLRADINDGKLMVSSRAKIDVKQMTVRTDVRLNDLNISERKEGKPFFAFERLDAKAIEFVSDPGQLMIKTVDILHPYARMKVDQNGSTNLSELTIQKVDANETNKDSTTAMKMLISTINFKEGTGEFSDLSLPLPFKTNIHSLNGKILAIGSDKDVKSLVDIDGAVDQYGLVKIKGSLTSADPVNFTDIALKFENIDMTNLSPYSGKFIGYKLEDGKMYVVLNYKINQAQMQGGNSLILKRLTLGDEVESEEAINAPVGLAIALLKDSEGIIDLDVPVSGNVNDPEFAIGHVVWTAFKNLITGIATAPFRFLGEMLGIDADKLENIQFEAGKTLLLPPQKETLDHLTTALEKKPSIKVNIAGVYDPVRDVDAIQTQRLYAEGLARLDQNASDFSHLETSNLQSLLNVLYEEHFSEEALESLEEKIDTNTSIQNATQRKQILQAKMFQDLHDDQKVSPEDLNKLGKERAQSIVSYLMEKGIDARRLVLQESLPLEEASSKGEYVPTKLSLDVQDPTLSNP